MRNVLLVVAGPGIGEDESARIQAAVAQALLGAEGEPRIFAVALDAPLDTEEQFHSIMTAVGIAAADVTR